MFLSQTAEYALRAMAWLATDAGSSPVRAADLSTAAGIPTHYLSKILRRLVLAELLVSQKGQGGGFSLARPAGEISFLEILAAVDTYPTEGRCAFGWGACDEVNPCPLHETWSRLNTHFQDWASQSNLGDLAMNAGPGGRRDRESSGDS
jgi:Rrf2 family iron-sulfur cluster assembly transcriptional regulator